MIFLIGRKYKCYISKKLEGRSVDYKIIDRPSFKIVWLKVKTLYEHSMNDIPMLWKKFNEMNFLDMVGYKKLEKVYGIYTNYESGFKECYDFMIGVELESVESLEKYMPYLRQKEISSKI